MAAVEVRDRDAIAAFCRRRPAVHAYALGDLDDFFWRHTRWFSWSPDGVIEQLVLLYDEPDPPVVLALAESPVETMAELLAAVDARLPRTIYAHVTAECLPALTRSRTVAAAAEPHVKLGVDAAAFLPATGSREGVALLGPADLPEVTVFYDEAYPGTWFHERMLETHRYVGLRVAGRLVSVAGVHVYSPRFGAAALGNVATLPAARGRGHAATTCSALCELLFAEGISTVSLNVRSDNDRAIGVYERLGFTRAAEYLEVLLG